MGHFLVTTLSTYTEPSTLIDWLWLWVACVARQYVCDLVVQLGEYYFHFSFFNSPAIVLLNFTLLPSWQFQITIALHPDFFNSLFTLLSLSILLWILEFQNSTLDVGLAALLQLCPCQKHPWTKITILCFGKTTSGLPERDLTFFLNRNPCLNKKLLTKISGLVSCPEIEAIIWLRFLFEKISAKVRF